MEPAVAKYGRNRRPIRLVDEKVSSPDEDRQLVVRSRPGFSMNPGHEGRVEQLDLVLHFADDRTAGASERGEKDRNQITCPAGLNSVSDQLGVTIHQYPQEIQQGKDGSEV